MSWFVIYLIACTVLWIIGEIDEWLCYEQVTLKSLFKGFCLSYIPIVNLVTLYYAIQRLLETKYFNKAIIKGRKRG